MKITYSKDVDILMMELTSEPIAYAEKRNKVVIHFNNRHEPVALEMLDAKDLLRKTYRALPRDIERQVMVA